VEFHTTEEASYFIDSVAELEIDGDVVSIRYARPYPLSRGGGNSLAGAVILLNEAGIWL
jgi:hypothetical protein